MFEEGIKQYVEAHGGQAVSLRAVLFDMDGVLFNSMPYHAEAWHRAMAAFGLQLSREEAFMHEGRTGPATINIVYRRQHGCDAPDGLCDRIYAEKSRLFNLNPEPPAMPGAWELLSQVKRGGLLPVLVTGSGQRTLLSRIDRQFPGIFVPERMVTAFDVRYGKPHPEPYLMGLRKAGVQAHEALVVENAPLGVQAAVAAGLLTVAVNTGPLPAQALADAGATIVLPSMQALSDAWETLVSELSDYKQ